MKALASFFFTLCLASAGSLACSGRIGIGDKPSPETKPTSDFGGAPAATTGPSTDSLVEPEWEWINPKHAAQNLRGIGGTSDSDLWLVGDAGTVLHWDGVTLEPRYTGAPQESYWAVWANASDDVWIAGAGPATGAGQGGHVLHWDGATIRDDYSLSNYAVHALWGASRNDAWAVVDNGAFVHWDGLRWTDSRASYGLGEPLRDVHGVDATHVWAVGAKGQIFALETQGPKPEWILSRASVTKSYWNGTGENPFDEANDYFAVFARTSNDVWAAFQRLSVQGELLTRFSHFDGSGWSVEPSDRASFLISQQKLARTPLRRGRAFAETRAGELVFASLEANPLVRRGSVWQLVDTLARFSNAVPAQGELGLFRPAGGALYGVTYFGGFGTLVESGNPPAFRDLVSGGRKNLLEVAPVGERAWAAAQTGELLRWDGAAWIEEGVGEKTMRAVFALSEKACWGAYVVGRPGAYDPNFTMGAVAAWNGASWTTTSLPDMRYASGVWASAPDDVWVVGDGAPFNWTLGSLVVTHFDGTSWTKVPVPNDAISEYPDKTGGEGARIWGLGKDDVWITITGESSKARVLHWNGHAWSVVDIARSLWPMRSGRAWASDALDVWIPARPALRFNGSAWSELVVATDFPARAIAGTSRDRVFLAGEGRLGGAIRRWNGTSTTTVLETSATILDVRTSPTGDVWAVGEGGTTVRLRPPRAARPY